VPNLKDHPGLDLLLRDLEQKQSLVQNEKPQRSKRNPLSVSNVVKQATNPFSAKLSKKLMSYFLESLNFRKNFIHSLFKTNLKKKTIIIPIQASSQNMSLLLFELSMLLQINLKKNSC